MGSEMCIRDSDSTASEAVLCKGSTADSDSVCLGSNPGTAAKWPRFYSEKSEAVFTRCGSVW